MTTFLVTGGAGFIGSNFIRFWLGRYPDDEIINLDLLTYAGDSGNLRDIASSASHRYRFVHGDIADREAVESVFLEGRPGVIVNFAAESHNSRAVLEPATFVRTNVVGTQVLLEAARRHGVGRFHHISTCEVYGDLPLDSDQAFTEDSPYRPRTPYNASKASADLLVRAYFETFGLPTTITNCSNNYGRFQHPEKLIPLFTTNAIDGLPLPLYARSRNKREWLHVDDHCRAIEAVLTRGRVGETYNVGSGDERDIEEIADHILGLLGRPQELKRYVPDRPAHDRRYLLDHSKITNELGWTAKVTFLEGLAETVNWYLANREWWTQKRDSVIDETAWGATRGCP